MSTTSKDFVSHTHDRVGTRLTRDLRDQLDGVAEFADFCAFLMPATCGERPQQLIDMARGLYEETLRVLDESGPAA